MKETKLKPCPFCGGKAHIYQDYTGYYVAQCDKCGIGTLLCGDENTAKRRWNRRVDNEQREGEWVLEHETYGKMICSNCKENAPIKTVVDRTYTRHILYDKKPFCPNCGAKMKGGNENE